MSNFRLSSRQHHHHSPSPGFHRSMPTYGSTLSCDNPFLRPASDPPQQLRHHPSLFRLAFNTSKAELHKYEFIAVHKLRYYSIPYYSGLNPDDRQRYSLIQDRSKGQLESQQSNNGRQSTNLRATDDEVYDPQISPLLLLAFLCLSLHPRSMAHTKKERHKR